MLLLRFHTRSARWFGWLGLARTATRTATRAATIGALALGAWLAQAMVPAAAAGVTIEVDATHRAINIPLQASSLSPSMTVQRQVFLHPALAAPAAQDGAAAAASTGGSPKISRWISFTLHNPQEIPTEQILIIKGAAYDVSGLLNKAAMLGEIRAAGSGAEAGLLLPPQTQGNSVLLPISLSAGESLSLQLGVTGEVGLSLWSTALWQWQREGYLVIIGALIGTVAALGGLLLWLTRGAREHRTATILGYGAAVAAILVGEFVGLMPSAGSVPAQAPTVSALAADISYTVALSLLACLWLREWQATRLSGRAHRVSMAAQSLLAINLLAVLMCAAFAHWIAGVVFALLHLGLLIAAALAAAGGVMVLRSAQTRLTTLRMAEILAVWVMVVGIWLTATHLPLPVSLQLSPYVLATACYAILAAVHLSRLVKRSLLPASLLVEGNPVSIAPATLVDNISGEMDEANATAVLKHTDYLLAHDHSARWVHSGGGVFLGGVLREVLGLPRAQSWVPELVWRSHFDADSWHRYHSHFLAGDHLASTADSPQPRTITATMISAGGNRLLVKLSAVVSEADDAMVVGIASDITMPRHERRAHAAVGASSNDGAAFWLAGELSNEDAIDATACAAFWHALERMQRASMSRRGAVSGCVVWIWVSNLAALRRLMPRRRLDKMMSDLYRCARAAVPASTEAIRLSEGHMVFLPYAPTPHHRGIGKLVRQAIHTQTAADNLTHLHRLEAQPIVNVALVPLAMFGDGVAIADTIGWIESKLRTNYGTVPVLHDFTYDSDGADNHQPIAAASLDALYHPRSANANAPSAHAPQYSHESGHDSGGAPPGSGMSSALWHSSRWMADMHTALAAGDIGIVETALCAVGDSERIIGSIARVGYAHPTYGDVPSAAIASLAVATGQTQTLSVQCIRLAVSNWAQMAMEAKHPGDLTAIIELPTALRQDIAPELLARLQLPAKHYRIALSIDETDFVASNDHQREQWRAFKDNNLLLAVRDATMDTAIAIARSGAEVHAVVLSDEIIKDVPSDARAAATLRAHGSIMRELGVGKIIAPPNLPPQIMQMCAGCGINLFAAGEILATGKAATSPIAPAINTREALAEEVPAQDAPPPSAARAIAGDLPPNEQPKQPKKKETLATSAPTLPLGAGEVRIFGGDALVDGAKNDNYGEYRHRA